MAARAGAFLGPEQSQPRQRHHRVNARHEGLALGLHLLVEAVVSHQVDVPGRGEAVGGGGRLGDGRAAWRSVCASGQQRMRASPF
jgi:hypothetical protein